MSPTYSGPLSPWISLLILKISQFYIFLYIFWIKNEHFFNVIFTLILIWKFLKTVSFVSYVIQ